MERTDTLLHEFRLTRSVALQWVVVSSLGFFLFVSLFYGLYVAITGQSLGEISFAASGRDGLVDLVVAGGAVLGLTLAVVVPHELVHGVAMRRYGGTPEYGAGVAYFVLPYAYARSDAEYTRNQTLVVLLAPLVVLSLAGLALLVVFPTPWLLVPLAANAAGSIGDVWMALLLLRYPADVRVGESADGTGLRIYGEEPSGGGRSIARFAASWVHGSVVGFGIVGALVLLGLVGSLALGVEAVTAGVPGSEVFLFRIASEPGGASVEFGFATILAASVAVGLAYAAVSSTRE